MYGGALTRYDGWFSATALGIILVWLFVGWYRRSTGCAAATRDDEIIRRGLAAEWAGSGLLARLYLGGLRQCAGLHQRAVFGEGDCFAQYGKGCAAVSRARHDIFTSALYFLKSAQLNLGAPFWGRVLLLLAVLGTAIVVWRFRRFGILLLLWLPLAFYSLSDRLWQRSDLRTGVVAVLVLQRALRAGTAAGFRCFSGDRVRLFCARGLAQRR